MNVCKQTSGQFEVNSPKDMQRFGGGGEESNILFFIFADIFFFFFWSFRLLTKYDHNHTSVWAIYDPKATRSRRWRTLMSQRRFEEDRQKQMRWISRAFQRLILSSRTHLLDYFCPQKVLHVLAFIQQWSSIRGLFRFVGRLTAIGDQLDDLSYDNI